jgi:hypothetical protein
MQLTPEEEKNLVLFTAESMVQDEEPVAKG